MFLTLDDAKLFLWIEDSDSDIEITQLIKDSEVLLGSLLGYRNDTMEEKDYIKWIYYDEDEYSVMIQEYNLKVILEVSSVTYSWVEDTDFIKEGLKKIIFIDNMPDIDRIVRNKIFVKYTAGYTTLTFPDELNLALKYLVSWLWNTKENIGIKSCKIWLESCTFSSISDQEDFLRIINAFKKQAELIIF